MTFEDRRIEGHSFFDGFSYNEDGNVEGLNTVEVMLIDTDNRAEQVKRATRRRR
jgi:hypothetical protein